MWSFSARRSGLEVSWESKRGGPNGPPLVWSEGSHFPPELARRPVGHGLESTVSTTRGSLSPEISGTSGRIVAHRLTPRIATLSPKPSTEAGKSADPTLQKTEDRFECAIPDEVLVTGLSGDPQLLRFWRGVKQRAAEPRRHNPVSLAVKNQDRSLDLADPRKRVEPVPHQRSGWDKGIMILGDFGDTGERRLQDQPGNRPLHGQGHGDSRSERLAVDHEPFRRDPLATEKIKSRGTVSDQAWFARHPWVAAIAAVLGHQHPVPVAGKPPQALGAVSDMAAIAVKICNDRAAVTWRQIPGEQ